MTHHVTHHVIRHVTHHVTLHPQFLPGVLSVGASASVFGLVGACWADVIVNYCARLTLRGAGLGGLLVSTVLNIGIGLTPWVDNFMHLGGFVCGVVGGSAFLSQRRSVDPRTGRRARTRLQRAVVFSSALLLVLLTAFGLAAAFSTSLQISLRACPFCKHANCVEISLFTTAPWWSCCLSSAAGACSLDVADASRIVAHCNMTGAEFYTRACDVGTPACAFDAASPASTGELCRRLCAGCA